MHACRYALSGQFSGTRGLTINYCWSIASVTAFETFRRLNYDYCEYAYAIRTLTLSDRYICMRFNVFLSAPAVP